MTGSRKPAKAKQSGRRSFNLPLYDYQRRILKSVLNEDIQNLSSALERLRKQRWKHEQNRRDLIAEHLKKLGRLVSLYNRVCELKK
jgi:hypothetical protein